jgi:VanZ family protein
MKSMNTSFSENIFMKWLPASLIMLAIFLFSAGSSMDVQNDLIERVVKKGGHIVGYGMLALSIWRGFEFRGNRRWLAWILAVLYAVTDEYHQSFVPGRFPSLFDVLVYDNLGAFISMWLSGLALRQKQPALQELVVDDEVVIHPG